MSTPSATATLAQHLIQLASITPHDGNCQTLLAERLRATGFSVEMLPKNNVHNLWARVGTLAPLLVFAGHTDVVPTGDLNTWQHPPFAGVMDDVYLHGRGAQDMKGGVAAMVVAAEQFLQAHPNFTGSIGFLITSGEEGNDFLDGTPYVIDVLTQRGTHIDYCVVGEPSCGKKFGDTIRPGRRGSLNATLTVKGIQGHVAYAHLANNPIHALAPALSELVLTEWDQGYESFPPTSLQISNITAGTGATNVIPGMLTLQCNFRYSPASTAEALQQRFIHILEQHHLTYEITWQHSGQPFLTQTGKLLTAMQAVILDITGIEPQLATDGGTSDARFIAPTGAEVIEFGTCNQTIHKVNECVALSDLTALTHVYHQLLKRLLLEA